MRKQLSAACLPALLLGPLVASAALVTYDFTVTVTSGALNGTSASGYFGFDDSIIPAGGGTVGANNLLTVLSFTIDGVAYDHTNANTGRLSFDAAGNLAPVWRIGTDCTPDTCVVGLSASQQPAWFIGQGTDVSLFGHSKTTVDGGIAVSNGSVELRRRTTQVNEPSTVLLLVLGLAGLATARRKPQDRAKAAVVPVARPH